MWKLKLGEGNHDPYLFSLNNFKGRQTWEFDPNAGTPEERAEVEAARHNFYNNRFNVKPDSDLLWRFQVRRLLQSLHGAYNDEFLVQLLTGAMLQIHVQLTKKNY